MTSNREVKSEVDWNSLDKSRFFGYGMGLFSGATAALYPLSVIKTRQMALDSAPKGLQGAFQTAAYVVRTDGVVGLYRGFVPTIVGAIPTRMLYLGTLEVAKASVRPSLASWQLSDAGEAFAANFIAGGCASLTAQSVVVPLDVVTQRLMLGRDGWTAAQSRLQGAAAGAAATAALGPSQHQPIGPITMVHTILRTEGVRGLYRGFGMSLATFVPSSSLWWACYASYQRLMWHAVDSFANRGHVPKAASSWGQTERQSTGAGTLPAQSEPAHVQADVSSSKERQLQDARVMQQPGGAAAVLDERATAGSAGDYEGGSGRDKRDQGAVVDGSTLGGFHQHTMQQVALVQAASAVLAGATASFATNPLDVIKTRIQTAKSEPGALPTVRGTLNQLLQAEGPRGLLRGVAPRMAASALWGTVMVSCYELLKRLCVLEQPDSQQ